MKIVLIGFMGSGKTTVGKVLSEKLNLKFVDLDHEIERSSKKKIREIFATEGEETFRIIESKLLRELLLSKESFVLSVGGGTPTWRNNLELMKRYGFVVYLNAPFKVLWNRIKDDANRPLAFGGKEKVEKLWKFRLPFYEKAHFKVDTHVKTPKEVADEIVSGFKEFVKKKNNK